MKDLQLLFCVISLFAGVSSISIACFIYTSNHKKALKFYIGLNFCLFAIQNAITLQLYSKYIPPVSSFIPFMYIFLDIIGTSFSSLFGMFFVDYLFGLKITSFKKGIYLLVFAFQFLVSTLYYFMGIPDALQTVLQASIICVILYELLMIIKNYNAIVNKTLKRFIIIFALTTLLFLPLITMNSFHFGFIRHMELIKLSALPAYFLVISVLSLIFVIKYFNIPAFIADNKLTDYFKQTYGITEKQGEVIELILEGLTYKQIAEKLFISPKTVDNHIQNIYGKLNVTSKLQLSNFVRSNQK